MIVIIGLIFFHDSNDRCSKEIRKNLILCLCTHQFIRHDPLCLVCAAVIWHYHVTGAVAVLYVTIIMTAAGCFPVTEALVPDRVTAEGGDCILGPAVETGMMNKGKTEAA